MSKEHPEFTLPDSVRIISYDEWVKELNTHEPTVKELQEDNERLRELALEALPILSWYKDNYPDCIAERDVELISKIEALK